MKLITNWLAFIFMITMNILANVLPIGGNTTGDLAERIDVFFTPAGYVFSIWSLIYLLLAIWLIRQIPESRRNLPVYEDTNVLFILSSLLNGAWIFAWHNELFLLSAFIMVCLLIVINLLYFKVKSLNPSFLDHLPFSIYCGWIWIATIANISYLLVEYNVFDTDTDQVIWTIFVMVVAACVAGFFKIKTKDRFFILVFIWALIGIGVENFGDVPLVANTAFTIAALLLVVLFILKSKKNATAAKR